MKRLLPKFIFPIIIIIFALSCTGTGLLMSLEKNTHKMNQQNSCCVSQNVHTHNNSSQSPHSMFVQYHVQSIVLNPLSLLFIVVFFFYKNAFYLFELFYLFIRQYLKNWQWQSSYLSLLLQRLFSLGILHSKIW